VESTNEETRGLEVSEKKQDQWEESEEALSLEVSEENGVKVEDESGERLGLQESELKEMELSAPEERPLDTNIEQEHMELGERKTDRQMKKLEKENRRQRKIRKKLTEERGEQLDQEFEPLRMQAALCQKNYMRMIKKQSMIMEQLIKKLRASPRNSTTEPDSMTTANSFSKATDEGDSNINSDMHEDNHTVASSRGDADYTLYDRVVHCTVLSSEDAVELALKDVGKTHAVWPTLKESTVVTSTEEKKITKRGEAEVVRHVWGEASEVS
jgi:hypothetical protein